jgi:hypothetical protein
MKDIFCYLQGSKVLGLSEKQDLNLVGYVDVGYLFDSHAHKS